MARAALWLPDVLSDAFRGVKGFQVEVYTGFATRGRSTGFDPFHKAHGGICNHHTGAGGFDALLRYMAETSSINPLCHWSTSRPASGIVRVVCVSAGRANHAGRGGAGKGGTPWVPTDHGNTYLVGGEHQNTGYQDWPGQQDEAIHIGSAAILKHLGHDQTRAVDHKHYAPGRKWDRHSVELLAEQAAIGRYLTSPKENSLIMFKPDTKYPDVVRQAYEKIVGREPESQYVLDVWAWTVGVEQGAGYASLVSGLLYEQRLREDNRMKALEAKVAGITKPDLLSEKQILATVYKDLTAKIAS